MDVEAHERIAIIRETILSSRRRIFGRHEGGLRVVRAGGSGIVGCLSKDKKWYTLHGVVSGTGRADKLLTLETHYTKRGRDRRLGNCSVNSCVTTVLYGPAQDYKAEAFTMTGQRVESADRITPYERLWHALGSLLEEGPRLDIRTGMLRGFYPTLLEAGHYFRNSQLRAVFGDKP